MFGFKLRLCTCPSFRIDKVSQARGPKRAENMYKISGFLWFCVGGSKAFHLDFWISLKQLYEISPVFLTPHS